MRQSPDAVDREPGTGPRTLLAEPPKASAPAGRSPVLITLSLVVAALAAGNAAVATFSLGGLDGPIQVLSVRGERVLLFGRGVYRFDTLFAGAGYRGQDWATLCVAVPALLGAVALYARGWVGSRLLLGAVLAFFVYANGSFALGAAYNSAYLLYVCAFSASVFALAIAFRESAREVPENGRAASAAVAPTWASAGGAPRPTPLPWLGPGALLIASGLGTTLIWLPPVVAARAAGETPPLLGTYTTLVTETLDLALVAPTAVFAGMSILRKRAVGYRLAFPLFGIIVLLAPTITAATFSQLAAGIRFTPGQVVGPIAAFLGMGVLAGWAGVAILRGIRRGAADPGDRAAARPEARAAEAERPVGGLGEADARASRSAADEAGAASLTR